MSVDAHVSGSTSQALVLTVRYVFVSERVDVLLGQAKVNDVDSVLVGCPKPPHQEILWLHVAVNEVFAVHILQSCNL